ncbi:MAG TPA: hypothetical protein VI603_12960 [Saprospiraceae bacterium]|nr:hypothetical protein [Saprospiraceae bacterium]
MKRQHFEYLHKGLLALCIFFSSHHIAAQKVTISGTVSDEVGSEPIAGMEIKVKDTNLLAVTDSSGAFNLEGHIPKSFILMLTLRDVSVERAYSRTSHTLDVGNIHINMQRGRPGEEGFTIQISEDDDEQGGGENISGLLSASRDVFQSTAAYTFGPMRFRLRGYASENGLLYLNGLPFNDLEVGSVFWSNWGGLNDVTRNQETHLGLEAAPYSLGGVGGSSFLDLRASSQWVQKRFSYSLTNRSYRNRVMTTVSTGLNAKGWAFTFSGSRRWSEEGYVPGTFYDAYAYFASIDKRLSDKHQLNLVVLGAPIKRGKESPSIQEMYDLAGTNYYNSYWGYQKGEKRNSRVSDIHQPIAMLRHDWTLKENSILTTTIGYQSGKNASSALEWFNANDPRPDYYRRLPGYIEDPALSARVREALIADETLRQIRWDDLYQVNYSSNVTLRDIDGITGNDLTGKQSQYIVEDRRYDVTRLIASTGLQHVVSDRISIHAGAQYNWQRNENFKVVSDLLGGEFYVNFDKFALQDFPGNTDALQNDLNHPNQIVREGGVFGYSYDANVREAEGWGQIVVTLPHFDLHGGLTLGTTSFWRTGNMRNGKFPNSSFGDSEKQNFFTGGIKGGATWKIDGRNYFSLNSMYLIRAPVFRNAMVSPRIRNEFVEGLTEEKILSGEAGYTFRAPYFKARLTGYLTQFRDQVSSRSFYHDDAQSFVNITMTGIDQQHIGLESFVEYTVKPGLKVHAVAAVGQYIYTSRPTAVITQDNDASVLGRATVFGKNFYVSGTPQSAFTVGLSMQTKYYLSAYLNLNYFDDLWIEYNPIRRTRQAIDLVEEGSPQWNAIIGQEKAPGGFTIDASVYKSFKIDWFKEDVFFAVTFNVSNALDKQDLISGGFEQLRYDYLNRDPSTFPSKYYYFPGLNYYFNASIRF